MRFQHRLVCAGREGTRQPAVDARMNRDFRRDVEPPRKRGALGNLRHEPKAVDITGEHVVKARLESPPELEEVQTVAVAVPDVVNAIMRIGMLLRAYDVITVAGRMM